MQVINPFEANHLLYYFLDLNSQYIMQTLNKITFIIILSCINCSFAQTGIGTNAPNEHSVLELVSNNKGLLLPRLSLTSSVTFLNGSATASDIICWCTIPTQALVGTVSVGPDIITGAVELVETGTGSVLFPLQQPTVPNVGMDLLGLRIQRSYPMELHKLQ